MSSILKVDQLQDSGGNAIITSDGAGNLTTQKINYPAFRAYLSSDQTGLGSATLYKVTFQSETYDTDNCFDNTTNYRFTPTVAGKYFFNYQVYMSSSGGASNLYVTRVNAQKNGSTNIVFKQTNFSSNPIQTNGFHGSGTVDMNGSSDYLEVDGLIGTSNSPVFYGDNHFSTFGAYKIIE